jgi:hypothetical protein
MDVQHILEAMDGIALVLDHKLAVVAVGHSNWQRFWRDNGGVGEPDLIGECITDFFSEGEVRDLYRALFHDVLLGGRPWLHIDFRCDAPTKRRAMRLAVTRIASEPAGTRLLYQSVLLSEDVRPALPLFAASTATHDAEAAVRICTICHKVKWPTATPTSPEWIEPQEYYLRGGAEVILLSHGFCPPCHASLRRSRS